VNVTGWRVEIQLRIPLDDDPGGPTRRVQHRPDYGRRRHTTRSPAPGKAHLASAVSSKDSLRSLRRFDVAEVGGQHRQHGVDVDTVAVPVDEGVHREAMPQVVNARMDGVGAQPEFGGEQSEPCSAPRSESSGVGPGHEERAGPGPAESIPDRGVIA
jgi:hypothetical protein